MGRCALPPSTNERKSVLTATGLSLSTTTLLAPTIHTAELIFFLQLLESIRAASYPGSVASWPKTKNPLHPTRTVRPQCLQRGTFKSSLKPIVRVPVRTSKRHSLINYLVFHQTIPISPPMRWQIRSPGYKKSTRLRRRSGGRSRSNRSNLLLPFLLHRQ